MNEDTKINKGGRPIPGYSFDKDGNGICDEQIKKYHMGLSCKTEDIIVTLILCLQVPNTLIFS
ncbi:hypothetical protein [Anaerosalibacter bizertensis]|uniref:Uncharacterized protein n=1 Tax=Anaerosalibacter bizertensis TaxID=932217 RepID=A0A9Q4AA72_9FIRM|nr:hypothetical protein [Anaerosalibacter bizertensis]MBV1819144.1 hypothetical protein [Bacteroidales bacterium MSK.15.36]MCG4563823.1 hypothetical protein [Anaerosalibacter bizertensis]MCG4584939.1 hypothetical protein [Anaerosalibacter bizertensis]